MAQGNRLVTKYWDAKDEAWLKIANLAIHLTDKSGVFEPNKENHLKPIISTSIIEQLIGPQEEGQPKHLTSLVKRIASDLKIDPDLIVDFELNIIDS